MQLKKIARRVLVVFALLLIVAFTSLFIFKPSIDRRIAAKLIERAGKLGYQLTFSNLKANLFTGDLSVINLTCIPTNQNYAKRSVAIAVSELELTDLSVMKFLFSGEVDASGLNLNRCLVAVLPRGDSVKTKENTRHETGPARVHLGKLLVNNGSLLLPGKGERKKSLMVSENGSLDINNLNISENSEFNIENYSCDIGKFSFDLIQGLYSVNGKGILISSDDSLIRVLEPELIPAYTKNRFAKMVGHQISRIRIRSEGVTLQRLDPDLFINEGGIVAEKLMVDGLKAEIFRDTNIPLAKIERPSLQELIKGFLHPLDIGMVEAYDSKFEYEQLAEGKEQTGRIFISGMDATITGLSNRKMDTIQFSSSGYLLGKGKMYLFCAFPMKGKGEHFFCSGSMGKMPMSPINSYFTPAFGLSFDSGQIDSMRFSFGANDVESEGELALFYHSLHIGIPGNSVKKRVSKSLLNALLVRDSNPGMFGVKRTSRIHFYRDPYRYFPYYLCRSVLSAVPSAVGIPITISRDNVAKD